ncbi:MAG: TetR/AcrR family transcriptional regulator [Pseudomonadota bacterium]
MKGEKTKQRVLEAASDLFWSRSFHSVSVADVAAAASVNKATLYQYFDSKEALGRAVVIDARRRTIDFVFEGAWAQADEPLDRLKAIYERVYGSQQAAYDCSGEARGCPFVNIAMEMAIENKSVRDEVRQTQEAFGAYYARILRALAPGPLPRDAEERAVAALVRNMNGAMVAARIEQRPEALLEAAETAVFIAQSAVASAAAPTSPAP